MTDNRSIRPFHLAFPVRDIQETEIWYTTILGCTTGRKSGKWIDFNFFGHQVVAHLEILRFVVYLSGFYFDKYKEKPEVHFP